LIGPLSYRFSRFGVSVLSLCPYLSLMLLSAVGESCFCLCCFGIVLGCASQRVLSWVPSTAGLGKNIRAIKSGLFSGAPNSFLRVNAYANC